MKISVAKACTLYLLVKKGINSFLYHFMDNYALVDWPDTFIIIPKFHLLSVPGNIHSGVSGNDSIMATGVFSASELLRVTRREYDIDDNFCKFHYVLISIHTLDAVVF